MRRIIGSMPSVALREHCHRSPFHQWTGPDITPGRILIIILSDLEAFRAHIIHGHTNVPFYHGTVLLVSLYITNNETLDTHHNLWPTERCQTDDLRLYTPTVDVDGAIIISTSVVYVMTRRWLKQENEAGFKCNKRTRNFVMWPGG